MNPELSRDAYDSLADDYARVVDTKPHNAYLDKPAVLELCGEVRGRKILEIGCGTGSYIRKFTPQDCRVVGLEPNLRMLRHAQGVKSPKAIFLNMNVEDGLPYLKNESFDLVLMALVANYVRNYEAIVPEIASKMKRGAILVLSTTHPFSDYRHYGVENYFEEKLVGCHWQGFEGKVWMPQIHRPLQALLNPVMKTGLRLEKIVEPQPVKAFQDADPERYETLMKFPSFIAFKASKP